MTGSKQSVQWRAPPGLLLLGAAKEPAQPHLCLSNSSPYPERMLRSTVGPPGAGLPLLPVKCPMSCVPCEKGARQGPCHHAQHRALHGARHPACLKQLDSAGFGFPWPRSPEQMTANTGYMESSLSRGSSAAGRAGARKPGRASWRRQLLSPVASRRQ